jgi:uncharacterized cupredoxin-like copper-binding protein
LNKFKIRRLGGMTAAAAFTLVMLAACGAGGAEEVTENVTRVPITSDAASEATQAAAQQEEASTPAAAAIETEASPAATLASVVISAEATPAVAASPVAATTTGATPVTAATTAAATPEPAATPIGATAGAAASPATGAEASPAGGAATAESVEVVSHDIFFEPKELTIPADTDVTVSLPNEGVTLHNFSIDELGISVDLAPGATEEVVINAPAGTYQYYCDVPGHKEAGMVGTLTVA